MTPKEHEEWLGIARRSLPIGGGDLINEDELLRRIMYAIAEAVAMERERCACIAETLKVNDMPASGIWIAVAIRSLGSEDGKR